jgi:hypothetical protein
VTPITRLTAAVHHREDEDVTLGLNRVEYGVREYVREAAANILFKDPPAFWSLYNTADRALDGGDETKVESFLTIRVIVRGVLEFLQRFRVELVSHALRRAASDSRTRANASPPGTDFTRPLRTSSRRRLASAAQR